MAGKVKQRKRYYEQRDNSTRFARHMRDWGIEFGESMEAFGRRIEDRFDEGFGFESGRRSLKPVRKTDGYDSEHRFHCHYPIGIFGMLTPLLKSLFGISMLAIFAWLLGYLGSKDGFFAYLSSFLLSNIALFFAVALLFEYAKYIIRILPRFLIFVLPVVNAAEAVWSAWIIMSLLGIVNIFWPHVVFIQIITFIQSNYGAIFVIFVALGFLSLPFRRRCRCGHDYGCDCCDVRRF